MTDPFSAMLAMQKQMIDAQRASMTAFHKSLGMADQLVAMQEAQRQAGEAWLSAWTSWSKMGKR
jgi:hypothetical protein